MDDRHPDTTPDCADGTARVRHLLAPSDRLAQPTAPARPPALQRGLTTRDCAGGRRSGKSSIQKVVFYKMSPHETLFLENTHRVQISGVPRHPRSLFFF